MFEPIKVKAMVNSLGKTKEVFIVAFYDNNNCRAVVDNKLCTAIYNPIVGLFYVDDKYGIIDEIEGENENE